jgi:hypothetical protein
MRGAGLGKSTLAHELVDSLQTDGRSATFTFLLRGSSTDYSHPNAGRIADDGSTQGFGGIGLVSSN